MVPCVIQSSLDVRGVVAKVPPTKIKPSIRRQLSVSSPSRSQEILQAERASAPLYSDSQVCSHCPACRPCIPSTACFVYIPWLCYLDFPSSSRLPASNDWYAAGRNDNLMRTFSPAPSRCDPSHDALLSAGARFDVTIDLPLRFNHVLRAFYRTQSSLPSS